jgi:hypothetical protein
VDLETCIVATYCLIDEALATVLAGQRLRQRGPQPILADSEVLTIEVVGEFLGLDQDLARTVSRGPDETDADRFGINCVSTLNCSTLWYLAS